MNPTCIDFAQEDFWRLDRGGHVPFCEWQHFLVFAEGLELLVNFSVVAQGTRHPRDEQSQTARVIVMAHDKGWSGFVHARKAAQIDFRANGKHCRIGPHSLRITPDHYDLQVSSPDEGIALQLRFEPKCVPMIAANQQVGGGRRLSWFMVPRGTVHGHVQLGKRHFTLQATPAYHDHNWGHFAWGEDFSWEWGIALEDGDWDRDALVFSSLQNRARSEILLEQILMWRHGSNVLSAGRSELTVTSHGPAHNLQSWVLPAVMSLIRGHANADLPEKLEFCVRTPRGNLDVCFCPEAVAELSIPSDTDPFGVVAIHECIGTVECVGLLVEHGQTSWKGRGVFEFLR